jgi:hypothetical protein
MRQGNNGESLQPFKISLLEQFSEVLDQHFHRLGGSFVVVLSPKRTLIRGFLGLFRIIH